MNQTNFPGRRKLRQEQSIERDAERAKRGDAGQLAHLDSLFGVGLGAERERERLQARMASAVASAEARAQEKAHQEQVRAAKAAAKQ